MNILIEHVARAICGNSGDLYGSTPDTLMPLTDGSGHIPRWKLFIDQARAAIVAIPDSMTDDLLAVASYHMFSDRAKTNEEELKRRLAIHNAMSAMFSKSLES